MMRRISFAVAVLAVGGGQALAGEPPALDNGLFATFNNSKTSVSFIVCGATGGTSGCYGSATLSAPFDYACGVLQGKPKTKGDTMTRAIYVLDKRTSSTVDAMLYVYERKDVIANGSDSVSATLMATVDLGITGGASSHCMLGGNQAFVYAATDASSGVVAVNKTTNATSSLSGTPLSITADDRGYIAMNFTWGFDVVDPDGNGQEDGGGTASFINQRNGWIQN
jgi:hypothetical protein